ncbi:MAG: hypothetical protein ACRDD1_20775, partial [Planctomycetia bacterium]
MSLFRFAAVVLTAAAAAAPAFARQDAEALLAGKKVLLLGDSITAAGLYAAYFDAWLTLQKFDEPAR